MPHGRHSARNGDLMHEGTALVPLALHPIASCQHVGCVASSRVSFSGSNRPRLNYNSTLRDETNTLTEFCIAQGASGAELQATLDEKTRKLFDYSDTLANKDRGIYYLERSIEARNRDLAELRKKAAELEGRANPDFKTQIDEGEEKITAAKAENEKLQAEVDKVFISVQHSKFLADKYSEIMAKVDSGEIAQDSIAEVMQNEISGLESANATNKSFLADVKAAVQDVKHGLDALRGQAKFLEQYRVDAIFRVFTLKAKVKLLKNTLEANEE